MQQSTWTLYPLWSDIQHLFDTWGKNRGPKFYTFSPGTEYHFTRNSFFPQVWRLRAHHFFLVVKERPGIWHQRCWLQINIIDVELVLWTFLETDQLPINHQHTSYKKLSVHCAFEEGFVGLHFVFDSTKWKKSVPSYSTNLRYIIWVGSPENRRWKNIWLLRIRRQFASTPDQGGTEFTLTAAQDQGSLRATACSSCKWQEATGPTTYLF
jgi:hypothetical protein